MPMLIGIFAGHTLILLVLSCRGSFFFLLQEADSDPTGEAADKTQQLLTYYELDLGLNHVVRKFSEQLEEHANFLISGKQIMICLI